MGKPESAGGREPWHVRVEDELRDRPGILWIYLLTDEAGAAWIARGQVPDYMKRQALDALAWSGTLERMAVELDPPAPAPQGELRLTIETEDK
jgi:hypothetical protein